MVLAGDVKNLSGVILLAEGHEITEKDLKILKMWGITEADIQGVKKEEILSKTTSLKDPQCLEEAVTYFQERFCHTDLNHPFIQELFHLLTLQRARDQSGDENHAP